MLHTNVVTQFLALLLSLFAWWAEPAHANDLDKPAKTVFYGKGRTSNPDEQSYALIRKSGESMVISGNGEDVPVDDLKKAIKGDFIWYREGERAYVIDDPALLDRANSAWNRYDGASDTVRTAKRELRTHEKTLSRLEASREHGADGASSTDPASNMRVEKSAIRDIKARIDALEQKRTAELDAAKSATRGLIAEAGRAGKNVAFPNTHAD